MSFDYSRPAGAITSVPDGSYGNCPENANIEEILEDQERFIPPPLLTKTQLIEQIGQEAYNQDPLWFLYDLTKYPCAKRFSMMSGLTFFFTSSFARTAFKLPARTCFRAGGIFAAAAGAVSLGHCAWNQYQHHLQTTNLRETVGGVRSYGIPNSIQEQRDIEKFGQMFPEVVQENRRKMKEMFEAEMDARHEEMKKERSTAAEQLLQEFEEVKRKQDRKNKEKAEFEAQRKLKLQQQQQQQQEQQQQQMQQQQQQDSAQV